MMKKSRFILSKKGWLIQSAPLRRRLTALFLCAALLVGALPLALAAGAGTEEESIPNYTQPEVTEPETTPPVGTELEPTPPEVTEPEPTPPEATEPEPTPPEVTEPEPTPPEVTEPEPTPPEVTEPEITPPEVTEPEITPPEATEPEPTPPESPAPDLPALLPPPLENLLTVPLPIDAEGKDVSNLIKPKSVTISYTDKNNKDVIIEDGQQVELRDGDEVKVSVTFEDIALWSNEDHSIATIASGDYAELNDLATGFSFNDSDLNLSCKDGVTKHTIGKAAFTTDNDGRKVSAKMEFQDEKNEVLGNQEFDAILNAQLSFSLSYKKAADASDGSSERVTILGKSFTIKLPEAKKEFQVEKSGVADVTNKVINWTVKVTGTQGDDKTPMDLKGYILSDDLSNVGEYVEGSDKVGGEGSLSTVSSTVSENNVLAYTFPENSISPQVITFQTRIKDTDLYANQEKTRITNSARLLQGTAEVARGEGSASFDSKWIEKKGEAGGEGSSGNYDPQNRTITWTITANHNGAALNNVVITDTPGAHRKPLTFQSAIYQTGTIQTDGTIAWNSEKKNISPNQAAALAASPDAPWKFSLGNISTPILLTVVTNVPAPASGEHVTGETTYTNAASITWDGYTGEISSKANVGIGYNAITKAAQSYDAALAQIPWTVTVDAKGQTIPDMKVYDLLVYGNTFNSAAVTGWPEGVQSTDLPKNYGQKYVKDSFQTSDDLKLESITLCQNGTAVADLLVISTAAGGGIGTTSACSFTYRTQVTDPGVFTKNGSSNIANTAALFSGNAKLNGAMATQMCSSQTLDKQALTVAAAEKFEKNPTAANATGDGDNNKVFNYKDKSVIFRLVVNKNGMNLAAVGDAIGNMAPGEITLTDTLPEGWEFQNFTGKETPYMVFANGTADGGALTAGDSVLTGASFDGLTASFTFSNLDQPYVVLLKAGPTEEKAKEYFQQNSGFAPQNKAELHFAGWSVTSNSSKTVEIKSEVLSKMLDSSKASTGGCLNWTIDYKPCELDPTLTEDGAELAIEDTLPLGIDLRIDSAGKLVLEGNFTLQTLTLQSDGKYQVGDPITLKLGENIFYDNETRVLKLHITDHAQACRLTYVTDLTGDAGSSVRNQVKLTSWKDNTVSSKQEYQIKAADASATLSRSGYIEIAKTGENGPLEGVEFTMFTADGSTVIRKGVTNAQGKLTLRGLPNGSYVLKETKTAEGYVLPADSYPVTVKEAKAVIGQQSGAQANQIAVKNLKASSVGNLTVTKEVTGNRGEFQKEFSFTLKLENATGAYPYSKTQQNSAEAGEEPAVETGMLKDGDTFTLQHGESITIRNIPKETAYTVVEADYSAEGYVTRVTSTPPMEPAATAAAARTVTGTIGAERTAEAHFINDKFVQGTLRIQKVAAFDGKTPLEGATFQVTGRDKVYYEIVTTDDLGVATIADLPLDVPLTLTELEAPEGYLVSEPVTFTLSDAASHVIQVENTRKGVLHLTKTAAYDGTTPLAGAVFTVTGEGVTFSNNTLTTDENGKASLTDLPVGVELTLTETKAPYGYQLLGEPVTFTLAGNETNAVVTQEISLKNLRKGILHIEKVASSDPERFLAGAEFTVTDGGGRQYGGVLVTDETGNITLTDLPLDVPLTLTETRAPSGYRMSGQPVNFTLTEGTEENPTAYEQTITVQNARKHSGGSNATTPVEPVEPVTPVGPADPVDPAEPVVPIEPVDPTNPSEPTESHPSEPPLDQPIAPSRVEKLPDNGIRGQISRDDPEYYLDENGVPRGIPPVEDPYYWLDEAGVPLGYLSPEGDWIWIEDAAVPLGFQTPEGNWVSFVPQTGDDSGQRLLLFLLSGGALLGLSAWGLLRRRNREEGD